MSQQFYLVFETVAGFCAVAWNERGWHFWQHTHGATFTGVDSVVDLNVFNGSLEQLHRFIRDDGRDPACARDPPACPP